MAEIQAFRALRYDLGHVGSLSDVVAPPYDVIGPELQNALYHKHPANVIRLILNRDEMGDDERSNRYTRAARFLKTWSREGVLQKESHPAIYVYHQTFTYAGREVTRRGFLARVRLQRFGEGDVYPHEETHAAAKADRLHLIKICKANLSPIFSVFPDPDHAAQELLDSSIADAAPLEATDHLGVIHRVWPMTDVQTIAQVTAAMSPKPLFIADGHHRYETACNYRDHLAAGNPLTVDHPAEFVLMMCVGMSDPGMVVLPTHRLFRGLPPVSSRQLADRLGEGFQIEAVGTGPERASQVWQLVAQGDRQDVLGLYASEDQTWLVARVTDQGRALMAEAAADRSPPWRELAVSLLHRLVMDRMLSAGDLPKPKYVHLVEEVEAALRGDEPFGLTALVPPASLEHIQQISELGERLPAKSTYFYPKLLSGLVIYPHQ